MPRQGFLIVLAHLALAFLSYGEVVDREFNKCKSFFYKNQPPEGLDHIDGSAYICQTYRDEHTHRDEVYYATHFSKTYRIPIYSAYRLDTLACPADQPSRRSTWFNEPQLYRPGLSKNMQLAGGNTGEYMDSQAINKDYPNTNFDKGHLNPNFYQCNNARVATFTLTNSVPQDPCFNQQSWKQMEEETKSLMTTMCAFQGAKRYFVTGAIPANRRIPNRWHDKEEDRTRVYDRVSVPSGMWTAACCDSSAATNPADRDNGFSFAYFGDNVPDSWVIPSSVSVLQSKLTRLYHAQVVDIFADPCYANSENSKRALERMAVPVERKVADTLSSMGKSSQSSMPPAKRRYVDTVDNILNTQKSVTHQDWRVNDMQFGICTERNENQQVRDALKGFGLSTMLMYSKAFAKETIQHSFKEEQDKSNEGISKHPKAIGKEQLSLEVHANYIDEVFETADDAEQQLSDHSDKILPIKTSNPMDETIPTQMISQLESTHEDTYSVVPSSDTELSANGDRCRADQTCDYYGWKYKWCYTDWSSSWDYCCTGPCDFHKGTNYQYCDTGSKWAYCSQRSSMLTVVNKPCRFDHECATHGKKYYWCYTDSNDNWDYCCQPWHDCLSHGASYNWCYVGYKKDSTWKYCYY